MPVNVSRYGETTTIVVDGSFDVEAMSRLRHVLRELRDTDPRDPEVVVDLGRARDVSAIALAALLEDSRKLPRLRYRGLSHHSARILDHLRTVTE
jgi:hypothetical protein